MIKKRQYVGNIEQLFGVRQYSFDDGRSRGVKAVEIQNGSGLDITILLDKCMDIYQMRYKGKNLNFITPTGIVAPQYYDTANVQWFRTWEAGFLTTCGLSNIGIPNTDGGEELGLHGRIHNTPAENVKLDFKETDDNITVDVCGTMRQAVMFGENLLLERKIHCEYETDAIEIEDCIYNVGYSVQPLMLLYHFNMGYPLLSEQAKYVIPSKKICGRDAYAEANIKNWRQIYPPTEKFREMCYYHELEGNSSNVKTVGIDNDSEKLFLRITYDGNILDKFIQWKMFGKGEYVSGLEPCNSTIDGRSNARINNCLKVLRPGEICNCKFKISVSDIKSKVEENAR